MLVQVTHVVQLQVVTGARGTHRGTGDPAGRRLLKKPGRVGAWVGPQRSSKRTLSCSRKLIHHQSQFLRAPTVLFASERGQGRAAFFAARRSKPLTLRSGEYAGEWLCAQQFRAHNHDDKAVIPPSQVGQVYERKAGQFLRASKVGSGTMRPPTVHPSEVAIAQMDPEGLDRQQCLVVGFGLLATCGLSEADHLSGVRGHFNAPCLVLRQKNR
jgi:hypothetical protein